MEEFENHFKRGFREVFGVPLDESDGLGIAAVDAELATRDLCIPEALRTYYAIAGRHRANEIHNRLLPISELDSRDEMLVFMEENQGVAVWGIRKDDLTLPDPVVWQGTCGDPLEWYPEEHVVSSFIIAMWRWTVTGEQT
jgi:hypothetical protein